LLVAHARMAVHAEIHVTRDLVLLDRVRDRRRLARVRATAANIEVLDARHTRRLRFLVQRCRTAQAGPERIARNRITFEDLLRRKDRGREQGEHECRTPVFALLRVLPLRPAPQAPHPTPLFTHTAPPTETIFSSDFLWSVCLEIGSVASSVTLLMSCDASNQGTNTTPCGGLLRPRVSTRVRISPRLDTTRTSTPRRTPSASASSGCMK